MDSNRLDEFSKALAAARTRRGFLRAAAGGLLGLVAGTAAQPRTGAAQTQSPQPSGSQQPNPTSPQAIQACLGWCQQNFPLRPFTPARGDTSPAAAQDCVALAISGQGTCFECGPGAPAQHPDLCGQACCPAATPTCCSGACTNIQSDAKNCGACGSACPSNQQCLGGVCTSGAISQPIQANGQSCASNSGCTSGNCSNGICCPSGQINCSGACVDTSVDTANCGGCAIACAQPSTTPFNCIPNPITGNSCTQAPASVTCVSGKCTPTCSAGQSICDGGCVNTSTDSNNCGGCAIACPPGMTCAGGSCRIQTTTCSPGLTACPEPAPGGGITSGCKDLTTDTRNCGRCGTVCGSGMTCAGGSCQSQTTCSSGLTSCPQRTIGGSTSSACVNLQTDAQNCGSCGNACIETASQSASCVNGTCAGLSIAVTCPSGYSNCPPNFGCSTNLNTDVNNCGACGHVCPWVNYTRPAPNLISHQLPSTANTYTCVNGACISHQCPLTWLPDVCNNTCVDISSDGNNCGACGNKCGLLEVCYGYQCMAPPNNCTETVNCSSGQSCCVNRCCDSNQACNAYTDANGRIRGVCCAPGQVPPGANVCSDTCTFVGSQHNCLSCGNDCGDPNIQVCCPGLGCRPLIELLTGSSQCGQ